MQAKPPDGGRAEDRLVRVVTGVSCIESDLRPADGSIGRCSTTARLRRGWPSERERGQGDRQHDRIRKRHPLSAPHGSLPRFIVLRVPGAFLYHLTVWTHKIDGLDRERLRLGRQ